MKNNETNSKTLKSMKNIIEKSTKNNETHLENNEKSLKNNELTSSK